MVKVGDEQAMAEGMNWYAVNTYSSFENKVKNSIERLVQVEGLSDLLGDVVIPMEVYIELKNGKKVQATRNLMPGYLLVFMKHDDRLFDLIRGVKGVSQFLGGGGGKPVPLSASEVDNILGHMESKADKPKAEISYVTGDQVKVVEGPFANFVGSIDHIDAEKHKLVVMVSIFGRPTPVELDVLQVEPAS